MARKILVLLLSLVAATAYAGFTANTDAGYLYGPGGTALPHVGSNTTDPNGGLILLIAAGGDQSFSNSLQPGQYVSGNDIVVGAASLNSIGGSAGTGVDSQNAFNVTLSLQTGDYLAIRWFPDLTYSQYLASPTIAPTTVGETFGTYYPSINPANGSNLAPDGGDAWTVPSNGSQISLAFYTQLNGGTQPETYGQANFPITAVPEPSSIALLGAAAVGALVCARFRRR